METFTAKHFETWLEHAVPDEDREQVRNLMLAEYANDSSYYDQSGWPKLFDTIYSQITWTL